MVYEWLYFAHQMLITIGIRGDTHSQGARAAARATGAPTASPRSPPAAPS